MFLTSTSIQWHYITRLVPNSCIYFSVFAKFAWGTSDFSEKADIFDHLEISPNIQVHALHAILYLILTTSIHKQFLQNTLNNTLLIVRYCCANLTFSDFVACIKRFIVHHEGFSMRYKWTIFLVSVEIFGFNLWLDMW